MVNCLSNFSLTPAEVERTYPLAHSKLDDPTAWRFELDGFGGLVATNDDYAAVITWDAPNLEWI